MGENSDGESKKEKMRPTAEEYEMLKEKAKDIVRILKKDGFGPKHFDEQCLIAVREYRKNSIKTVSNKRFGMLVGVCKTAVAIEYKKSGLDPEDRLAVSPTGDIHDRARGITEPISVPSQFSQDEMERMLIGSQRQSENESRRMGKRAAQDAGYESPSDED